MAQGQGHMEVKLQNSPFLFNLIVFVICVQMAEAASYQGPGNSD